MISVYINGVKIILKFRWENGFLKGGSMEPPYALTEVRGTLCSWVLTLSILAKTIYNKKKLKTNIS